MFWTQVAMHIQTKFLRLCKPASLGDRIDDWRICWLGGWDKCRVFFIVMVEREYEQPVTPSNARAAPSESYWLRTDIALTASSSNGHGYTKRSKCVISSAKLQCRVNQSRTRC